MAKHKYIFEYDDNSEWRTEDESKMISIVKIHDYKSLILYIFDDVLRYKRREEELEGEYGEKATDLIDEIREKIANFMEEREIPFE